MTDLKLDDFPRIPCIAGWRCPPYSQGLRTLGDGPGTAVANATDKDRAGPNRTLLEEIGHAGVVSMAVTRRARLTGWPGWPTVWLGQEHRDKFQIVLSIVCRLWPLPPSHRQQFLSALGRCWGVMMVKGGGALSSLKGLDFPRLLREGCALEMQGW